MKRSSLSSAEPHTMAAKKGGTNLLSSEDHNGKRGRGIAYGILLTAVLLTMLASLNGCSSDSGKPAEEAKPEVKGPELLTARSAFQKLYVAARGWSQDAKPYRLEAVPTSDGNGHDGKWAVWKCSFASAAQRSQKTYTWSGSAAADATGARHQSQPRRQLQPFELIDTRVRHGIPEG